MKITDTKNFGQYLKKRRKQKGYTQQELAMHCGCSTSFISHLENGRKTAEIEKSIIVAHMLGIDIFLEPRS